MSYATSKLLIEIVGNRLTFILRNYVINNVIGINLKCFSRSNNNKDITKTIFGLFRNSRNIKKHFVDHTH